MATLEQSPLLQCLAGRKPPRPPIWMMRQAGRHLPEYRELRAKARNFLDFCYSPSLAAEATLQPIDRYGMDGAILFADILLILDAMGLEVRFEEGAGPIVEKMTVAADLSKRSASAITDRLSPVFETVERVAARLPDDVALIGFAGAPWTVALYAIEGRGKTDQSAAKSWAYERPAELRDALFQLADTTALYLEGQVDAGADALMLFDSWAEGLPDDVFRDIIIAPTMRLVDELRRLGVDKPIIGFPRGAGVMLGEYAKAVDIQGVGLDTAASPAFVNAALPAELAVQGHLDPLLLVAGGDALDARVRRLMSAYADRPHIFNLGHGVTPATPIPHVERVVGLVKGA